MRTTEARLTYAQNKEDLIVLGFFPHGYEGFYIDVGAGHPTVGSVTKLLYENGWHGVNVEPNKELNRLFIKERPRDINLNIGISDKPGKLTLRQYEQFGLSTFSKQLKDDYSAEPEKAGSYKDTEAKVTTLADICTEHQLKEIDLLKIDVEGLEYEVLAGNDWKFYRPKLICIETSHIIRDWHQLLSDARYHQVFSDGLNEYYAASEHKNQLTKEFSFADKVLLGPPIIEAAWHHKIQKTESDRDHTKTELQTVQKQKQRLYEETRLLRNALREKDDEITYLQAFMLERARLRSLVKEMVVKFDSIATTHLTKRIRNKKRYPAISLATDESNPSAILKVVQQADRQAFLAQPSLLNRLETVLVRAVYLIYKSLKRLIYRSLRFLKRKLVN